MSNEIAHAQVREWIDREHVGPLEDVADGAAEFNIRVVYSGLPVHVIKNRRYGPLRVSGQVTIPEDVRPTFRDLSDFDRRHLEALVREQLTTGSGVYYFLDEDERNVPFEDVDHVRIERFIYPDGASQHLLMTSIFQLTKQLFYLHESITTLVENVESRR